MWKVRHTVHEGFQVYNDETNEVHATFNNQADAEARANDLNRPTI